MKILTVVHQLSKGGTARAAQNFCEGYKELGHDSRALALVDGGTRIAELGLKQIPVYINLEKSLANIKEWKPDVIHTHTAFTKEELSKIKSLNQDAILAETSVFSRPREYEKVIDYSFQLSNWCLLKYLAIGGSSDKAKIVSYPVKTGSFQKAKDKEIQQFRQKYKINPDKVLIGRVGQRLDSKWSMYNVTIFEELLKNNSNIHFLVVNAPKYILDNIEKKGLSPNVTVIDKIIGDENLSICYSAIDIFVHIANIGESFGMVLAESLLCETPVACLNTPWKDNSQKEVIGLKKGGYAANSIHELNQQIQLLINSATLRNAKGKAGRKHIIEEYDYLKVSREALNYFDKTNISTASTIPYHILDNEKSTLVKLLFKLNLILPSFWLSQKFLKIIRFSRGFKFQYR